MEGSSIFESSGVDVRAIIWDELSQRLAELTQRVLREECLVVAVVGEAEMFLYVVGLHCSRL